MKKIVYLFSALLLCLSFTSVKALELTQAGDTVVQEGDYNSIRLVAGNNVTNKANIDGLSLVAGNDLELAGSAPYGFFAGNQVKVKENIEKDLFVAGNVVEIAEEAMLGRDVFVAGNQIKIKALIARDLRVGGTSVDLRGATIIGDAYVEASDIILDESTSVSGTLSYNEDANIEGLDKATITDVKTTESTEVEIEFDVKDAIISFILSTLAEFIVLVVIFYLFPKAKDELNKTDLSANNVVKLIGIGLGLLIATPIVCLIALFTNILAPLSIITFVLYCIAIYISTLIVSYIIGSKFTDKVLKNDNVYLSIICGVLLVKLIKLIPGAGFIFGALILFFGLGLLFDYMTKMKK